jgi:Holliday junction DNA helicase RuvA
MFAFLRGTVARKAAGRVELDVNGVGYEVLAPDSTLRKLHAEAPATLLTHCHIREDLFQIYGFLRDEERALFRMILGITGFGPKVALAILSTLSVQEVGRAVLESDVAAFTKVSGVGKKGAQRLVLEMKAKLGQDLELGAFLGDDPGARGGDERDDVFAALTALGCTAAEAKRAAALARESLGEGATDEDLVRAALRSMSKV